MPTPEANWIKMTTIKPTVDNLPVWYTGRPGHQTGFYRQLSNNEGWTHWKPARNDVPPPPKVETQHHKDIDALTRKFEECGLTGGYSTFLRGGLFALESDRAFFRAELAKLSRLSLDCTLGPEAAEAYDRMVERCREEGS